MVWIIVTILAGMVLPIQAGINSTLAKHLSSAPQAALISFMGGVLMMTVFCLLSKQHLPSWRQVSAVSPYLLIGGFLGGVMVITAIIMAPKIGAVALVGALVTGQLIFSIVLDHFGWVGFPVKPISLMRLLGVVFLIAGIFIIQRF